MGKSALPKEPTAAEITPEPQYARRREFLKNAALFAATAGGLGAALTLLASRAKNPRAISVSDLPPLPGNPEFTGAAAAEASRDAAPDAPGAASAFVTGEPQTPFEKVAGYNNFYEFGVEKSDPAAYAHTLRSRPWTVEIDGEVARPLSLDIDALIKLFRMEERIYRMRCVERWSMVIPWLGFPLASLIKHVQPTSKAKYVAFKTLLDPEQMPGQKRSSLLWPYVEGLRIDEAVHPLTLLAVGLYGKTLPNQNGAPLRLVVPWKYGFKGIKSIVKISLTEHQPSTSWSLAASREYGFYANVNPQVDHPRWSQASERRIGEVRARPTLMFNGYAEQVAGLYEGMDLARFY